MDELQTIKSEGEVSVQVSGNAAKLRKATVFLLAKYCRIALFTSLNEVLESTHKMARNIVNHHDLIETFRLLN